MVNRTLYARQPDPARRWAHYPDSWVIIASPGQGDTPSIIEAIQGQYNTHGDPKGFLLRHNELVPAERSSKFAGDVRERATHIREKFECGVTVLVDQTVYPTAREQFQALSDATYFRVVTGDSPPVYNGMVRQVGRLYLLSKLRAKTSAGLFDVKLLPPQKAFYEAAMHATNQKPPRIEPADALLSDADEKERSVLACAMGLIELDQSVSNDWYA